MTHDQISDNAAASLHAAFNPAARRMSAEQRLADALQVLRMVDDNHRVDDGEVGCKSWRHSFVVSEVRRVLTEPSTVANVETGTGHRPAERETQPYETYEQRVEEHTSEGAERLGKAIDAAYEAHAGMAKTKAGSTPP